MKPYIGTHRKEEQLDRLATVMTDILNQSKDVGTRNILFFIQRTLRQFQLYTYFDEAEIIGEAYIRTRRRILEEDIFIENIPAWLTKVSFNIIREHKRKACRDQVISQELTSHDEFKNRNEEQKELDCEMKKKINFLLKSLSELKEEDLEIIRLRFVQGLTWDETSKYLIRFRGDLKIKKTENSLRKRGSRILYRLRQAFEDFDDVA